MKGLLPGLDFLDFCCGVSCSWLSPSLALPASPSAGVCLPVPGGLLVLGGPVSPVHQLPPRLPRPLGRSFTVNSAPFFPVCAECCLHTHPVPPAPALAALWFMKHFLAGVRFALHLRAYDSSAPELPGLGPAAAPPPPTSTMTPAQDVLHSSPCWPAADPACHWCDSPCPALASCTPLGAARCRLLTPLLLEFWSPMAWPCPAPLVPWSSEPMASCPCPACHGAPAKPPVGCPDPGVGVASLSCLSVWI